MKRLLGRLTGGAPPHAPTPATTPPTGAPSPPPGASPPGGATPDATAAPSAPTADARRIDLRELRTIVSDADELRKGTEVFDRGGLAHLARHGERIFCEAAGSGSSPYRVTITIPAGARPTARCSCFAARTRPFCKHASALVVAWARAPESFVVAAAPPIAEPGAGGTTTRRASVRTGKAATSSLQSTGVEQALALVRELAAAGVATAAVDRPDQIHALAETLRANRLRRLSARVHELADLLDGAAKRRGSLSALAYSDVVADLLLTARRIERHLGGETLEEKHVEELIGRNWRKADRRPVDDLDLTQYAYLVRSTADDFVIRERRLIDLATGIHYSEKQILPAFMARRAAPIVNEPGVRIGGTGGVYPGFAPHRLDTEDLTTPTPLAPDDLRRLAATALAGPTEALAAFQEHRRDVFAPDALPVAVRADAVVALGDRLAIVGSGGDALLLTEAGSLVEGLEDRTLQVVLGDVDLDGILAVLRPLAALTDGRDGPALRAVPADAPPREDEDGIVDWLTAARAAGASPASLSLAEIRDELAVVLTNGLGSLTDRVAEPLATRLADLGLERPSALLREVAARPDPADRLDDLVRLLQVLAIGAVRLAGARQVDRTALVPVPGHPALLVPDPGPPLPEDEVARRRWMGSMGWPEATVHRARRLAALPETALGPIVPWWADASATSAVVAAATAGLPASPRDRVEAAVSLRFGLTAALTGIAVAEQVRDGWADTVLAAMSVAKDASKPRWASEGRFPTPERALRMAANRAVAARRGVSHRTVAARDPGAVADLLEQLGSGRSRDRRTEAARSLARLEDRSVLPALRRSFRSDPANGVRVEAAWALASVGDTSMVDGFIDALAARNRNPDVAKGAAYGLGLLGDIRGVRALLDALAEGWKTSVVLEALAQSGEIMVPTLIERVLSEPALAGRRGYVSALEQQPAQVVLAALLAAMRATPSPDGKQQVALLRLAASHKEIAATTKVATEIMALPEAAAEATARRSADAILNPKPRAKRTI